MHELLDAFREEAELHLEVPTFDDIEQRGRSRRRRRQAVIGAVAASVIAVTGFLATAGGQPPESRTANPTTPGVTPYPTGRMVTLTPGTYELQPFADPAEPVVHVKVPPLWNAWEGPNRFEGISAGSDNSEALGRTDWLVGLVVLDVTGIAARQCGRAEPTRGGAGALVEALTQIPRLRLIGEPEQAFRYGTRATRLRLEDRGMTPACPQNLLFETATSDPIYLHQAGDVYTAWVVETDAGPLLLWSVWTKDAPQTEINALVHMMDTIELAAPASRT